MKPGRKLGKKYPLPRRLHGEVFLVAEQVVAAEFAILPFSLQLRRGKRVMNDAKAMFWFLLKIVSDVSSRELSRAVGFDHRVILYGWRRALGFIKTDPNFRERYDRIAARYCQLTT